MGNMREISIDECRKVSGGINIPDAVSDTFDPLNPFGMPQFQNPFLAAGSATVEYIDYDPERDGPPGVATDENEDGGFDVIVVTGSPAGYYTSSSYTFGAGKFAGLTFTLSLNLVNMDWYGSWNAGVGFGSPTNFHIGHSQDVHSYLAGDFGFSGEIISAQPGMPTVYTDGTSLDFTNTTVMDTSGSISAGVGSGININDTLFDMKQRMESYAAEWRDNFSEGLAQNFSEGLAQLVNAPDPTNPDPDPFEP